jgi:hypothetical protein
MFLASSYSYPLLGAFWTIFEIFLWVIWIWILIYVFIDIFRSRDLSGWGKALWFIFVLFIPEAQQQDQEARRYIQEAAGTTSTADQLAKLADLRDRGVITPAEFDSQKAKILA